MDRKIANIVNHAEVSEKAIEKYLNDRVKERGGISLKYSNPNSVGYPDRIVLMPFGITFWVELKSKGKSTQLVQDFRIKKLRELGHTVFICDSKESVDSVLDRYAF